MRSAALSRQVTGNGPDGGRISPLERWYIVNFKHGLSRKGRAISKRKSLLEDFLYPLARRHSYQWSSTQRSWLT